MQLLNGLFIYFKSHHMNNNIIGYRFLMRQPMVSCISNNGSDKGSDSDSPDAVFSFMFIIIVNIKDHVYRSIFYLFYIYTGALIGYLLVWSCTLCPDVFPLIKSHLPNKLESFYKYILDSQVSPSSKLGRHGYKKSTIPTMIDTRLG